MSPQTPPAPDHELVPLVIRALDPRSEEQEAMGLAGQAFDVGGKTAMLWAVFLTRTALRRLGPEVEREFNELYRKFGG